MPTKIISLKTNREYGKNGCYFCQFMKKTEKGISPQWKITCHFEVSMDHLLLDIIPKGGKQFYGVNSDGIWKYDNGWSSVHSVAQGNRIGFDRQGNLIYPHSDSIGKYDGITWTDSWKSWTNHGGPNIVRNWEGLTLIVNKYEVAGYTGDGSDFNTNLFDIPSIFSIVAYEPGKNGILFGANYKRGWLILWDGYSPGAIAPWIPLPGKIVDIAKSGGVWIVALDNKEFYLTNGYSIRYLTKLPGKDETACQVKRIAADEEYLLITTRHNASISTGFSIGRQLAGIYIYNFKKDSWSFAPFRGAFNSNPEAICLNYYDQKRIILTSYYDELASTDITTVVLDEENSGEFASYISPSHQEITKQILEGIILKLNWHEWSFYDNDYPITVRVKFYDFKRDLWRIGKTNASSSGYTQLKVDGTERPYRNCGEIGDEVIILEKSDSGLARHITNIQNKGTNTEVWTLNENLLYGDVPADVHLIITSSKLVGKEEIKSTNLKELYFNVSQKPVSRDFMVKVEFEDTVNQWIKFLELTEIGLVLSDFSEI